MSLIELLAALSLSAMLMAVLLGTVSQQVRHSKKLREEKPVESWQTVLTSQLQRDYSGCRQVLLGPNRLALEGYSRVAGTGRIGPTRINYLIRSGSNGNLLVREETDLLSSQADRVRREIVCRGVSGFASSSALDTDVAPGVINLNIDFVEDFNLEPLKISLVRF